MTGKRKREGDLAKKREGEAGGKRSKTGCMLELESKLGGRKLKQGSRLSGLATTFFPVYFIFFHISHVSFSMISTPFAGLLHLVIIGFIFEELELILYYILVSIFPC